MPQRFTEVTDFAQVARRGRNWASFNTSDWKFPRPRVPFSFNDTNGTAARIARRVARVEAPSGAAFYVLVAAATLLVLHCVLSRVLAKKYVKKYGHAD